MARSRRGTQAPSDIPAQRGTSRKELDETQAAAPLAAEPAPFQPRDVFAPTNRPNEPITSGAALGAGPSPAQPAPTEVMDTDLVLRLAYSRYPHPGIARLIRNE